MQENTAAWNLAKMFPVGDEFNGERFLIDTPEKRLLVSILERAIKDLLLLMKRKHTGPSKHKNDWFSRLNIPECYSYFFKKSRKPYTIRWILQHIAQDPEAEQLRLQKIAHAILTKKKLPDTYLYKKSPIQKVLEGSE